RNGLYLFFFFSSRRRHTRSYGDWSSDVCSSDLLWNHSIDACVRGSDSMSLILIVSHRTTNVCTFFPQQANPRSSNRPRTQKSYVRVHSSPTKNREIQSVRCQLSCQ